MRIATFRYLELSNCVLFVLLMQLVNGVQFYVLLLYYFYLPLLQRLQLIQHQLLFLSQVCMHHCNHIHFTLEELRNHIGKLF